MSLRQALNKSVLCIGNKTVLMSIFIDQSLDYIARKTAFSRLKRTSTISVGEAVGMEPNVDNPMQQLVLIASLAALHDSARAAIVK